MDAGSFSNQPIPPPDPAPANTLPFMALPFKAPPPVPGGFAKSKPPPWRVNASLGQGVAANPTGPAVQVSYEPAQVYHGGDKGGGKGGGKNEVRPGDWACEKCGANNFARRTECFKCGAAKPGGEAKFNGLAAADAFMTHGGFGTPGLPQAA